MKNYKIVPNGFLLGFSFGSLVVYGFCRIFFTTIATNETEMLLLAILAAILSILFGKIKEIKEIKEG